MYSKYTINRTYKEIIIIKLFCEITHNALIWKQKKNSFMINDYVLKYPKCKGW
jgi:hypothetical protein